ncbi:BlaI/MecI/CopY family transcriptional regulator [Streptomyces sp. NPDC054765]
MTRVWEWNRPVTVREVLEDLQKERSIAYTTVMTVLDNLHQKGWVRREAEGRAYRYEAVSTRAAYAAALMNEAWSASDNPAAALVAFFGMMSPEQRQALRDAVRMVQVDEPAEGAEGTQGTQGTQGAEGAQGTEQAEQQARVPEGAASGQEGEAQPAPQGADEAGAAGGDEPGASATGNGR